MRNLCTKKLCNTGHSPLLVWPMILPLAIMFSSGVLLATNATEGAEKLSQELFDQANQLESRNKKGFSSHSKQGLDSALANVNKAIQLTPNRAGYYLLKAIILRDMDMSDQALPALDKAKTIAPTDWNVLYERAHLLSELGRPDEALPDAEAAVKLHPHSTTYLLRAEVLGIQKKWVEAENDLDQAIKLNPDSYQTRAYRSRVSAQLHKWQKVIDDTTYILTKLTAGGTRFALCHRAVAYVALKNYPKAIADYKAAQQKYPGDRQIHQALLNLYVTSGDKANAAIESSKLATIDSDYTSLPKAERSETARKRAEGQ
jgi:tetratricopeptide (TPR) repeat protein